jgi:hypothetical protein
LCLIKAATGHLFQGHTEVHSSVVNSKILEMYRLSGHPQDPARRDAGVCRLCASVRASFQYGSTQSLLARDGGGRKGCDPREWGPVDM